METAKCYKCGKTKVSTVNQSKGDTENVEMTMMTWGKHKNEFFCKDCKSESKYLDSDKKKDKDYDYWFGAGKKIKELGGAKPLEPKDDPAIKAMQDGWESI